MPFSGLVGHLESSSGIAHGSQACPAVGGIYMLWSQADGHWDGISTSSPSRWSGALVAAGCVGAAGMSLSQPRAQWHQIGGLRGAVVGEFAPQEPAKAPCWKSPSVSFFQKAGC